MKDIKNIQWSEFVLSSIFDITSTRSGIDKNKLVNTKGHIPYVTRSDKTNGWENFIGQQDTRYTIDNGNCISVGLDTQTAFYQPCSFYTGQNIQVLRNSKLNKYIALFIIPILKQLMSKFSWGGNGATLTRLKRSKIILPITSKGEPNYDFMEQYMGDLEKEKIASYKELVSNRISELSSKVKIVPIKGKKWGEFCLKDLFDFQKGNQTNMTILNRGNTPLVSARKIDNGYKDFINTSKGLFQKNSLSLNNDGDGGAGISYYQPYEAALDSHVTALLPKFSISKHALLFISRSITSQRGKFGHGYSLTNNRLSAFKLMLPVNSKGSPDYEYMEQYMKQIEINQLIKYINFTNNK